MQTPGFVPISTTAPTAIPKEGSGPNLSVWDYEGTILAYLDEFNINLGKDAIYEQEKETTGSNQVNDVTNPAVAGNELPSPNLLAGVTVKSEGPFEEIGPLLSHTSEIITAGLPLPISNIGAPLGSIVPIIPSAPVSVPAPAPAQQKSLLDKIFGLFQ
jgi:hypothetical protein